MRKLLIGNKNYSSWSLRPWLVLRHFEVPFEEVRLSFNDPDFASKARAYAPTALVPVLISPEFNVWDSLAIVETIADDFRDRAIWPVAPQARAFARSICAQMHAGFADMRRTFPMNASATIPGIVGSAQAQADVDTIHAIWSEARQRFGQSGPYLFGEFSAADAYFAPVVLRFRCYGLVRNDTASAYMHTMLSHRHMQQWIADAKAENEFVADDEPYRQAP